MGGEMVRVKVELVVVLLSREAVAVEDLEADLASVVEVVLVETAVDQLDVKEVPVSEQKCHSVSELAVEADLACTGTRSWTSG